ncbi:MAG TPA: GDSL-type esterase/lipase family protein [Pyrinomonadaceae bacterium]|jgi:lysophospholipase L1-like esterase
MKRFLYVLCLACALAATAAAKEPLTIHLAGDSTMAEKLPEKRPETGWGEMLQQHFRADRVRVMNHAKNGRSTRLFIEQGLWRGLLDALKEGDYVFIQFGHNDGAKDKPDRYTPPEDYRANLARFVREARAQGDARALHARHAPQIHEGGRVSGPARRLPRHRPRGGGRVESPTR